MSDAVCVKKFVLGPLETNCYLVYGGKSLKGVLIDPGADDKSIRHFISENHIDIIWTLNTHGHADHIMGNAAFAFPVMIHELDAPCLTDAARNFSFFAGVNVPPVAVKKLLTGGDVIDIDGLRFHVIHTPGHTPGGISIKCADMLFSGDTLFWEGVGRTDLPGGSHKALINSIKTKLFTLPDATKVFPGHGPETTIGHEKRCNPFA